MKLVSRLGGYLLIIVIPLLTLYYRHLDEIDFTSVKVHDNYILKAIIFVAALIVVIGIFIFIDQEFKEAKRGARLIWRLIKASILLFVCWQGSSVIGITTIVLAEKITMFINTQATNINDVLQSISFTFMCIFFQVVGGFSLLIFSEFYTKKKKTV